MPRAARPAIGRFGRPLTALADQAVMSGSNFLTLVLLARTLGPAEFGSFTVVYTAVLLAGVLQYALITQPHNVLGASLEGTRYRRYTGATGLGQLAFSAASAALAILAAVVAASAGSPLAPLLLAAAPAAVALQLQEFSRRVLYTEERVATALGVDVLGHAVRLAVVGTLAAVGRLDGTSALVAIAATSGLAAALGMARIRPNFAASGLSAVRDNLDYGKWVAGEQLGYWVATELYIYLTAIILGTGAVGTLRAALLLFNPLYLVLLGYYSLLLQTRLARTYAREGPGALAAELRRTYAVAGAAVISYCVPVVAFAGPVLESIYGASYAGAAPLVLLSAAHASLVVFVAIVSLGLRAMRRTRRLFVAYVVSSVPTVALGWALVGAFGIAGAISGMALSSVIVFAYCWWSYLGGRDPLERVRSRRPATE
ncbi:MAG: lipopolysaccharide biosynthesis protein [Thermoleophilaceae bacterium]